MFGSILGIILAAACIHAFDIHNMAARIGIALVAMFIGRVIGRTVTSMKADALATQSKHAAAAEATRSD